MLRIRSSTCFSTKRGFFYNFLFDTLSLFFCWCSFGCDALFIRTTIPIIATPPNDVAEWKFCAIENDIPPFNFKLCSYLINLIYTDNPIHIHYFKSWMASRFQKSKGNYIKSYTIFLDTISIHNPVLVSNVGSNIRLFVSPLTLPASGGVSSHCHHISFGFKVKIRNGV